MFYSGVLTVLTSRNPKYLYHINFFNNTKIRILINIYTIMKIYKIFIILTILILSCSNYNPSNPNNLTYINANHYNFKKHIGKTIKYIYYNDGAQLIPGCDDLVITFTDGTRIDINNAKYDLEIIDNLK